MDDRQFSPDSSTHTKSKSHKRKSSKSHKKGSKKKRRSNSVEKSPSPDKDSVKEWLNTPEDALPLHLKGVCLDAKLLKEYLPEKAELHKQLFKLINKKAFKKLLPSNLKKYDAKEVRSWCLTELKTMSKKRIRCAINNEEMLSSSSSEDESLISSPDSHVKMINNKKSDCNNTGDDIVVMEMSLDDNAKKSEDGEVADYNMDGLSLSPEKEDIDAFLNEDKDEIECQEQSSKTINKKDDIPDNSNDIDDHTLTVLEMELRARALQSLLKRK